MSERTLKFNNIRLNKKKIFKSEEPIDSMSIIADQIVVSDDYLKLVHRRYSKLIHKRYSKLLKISFKLTHKCYSN